MKNWTILGVLAQELEDKKILSKEDLKFLNGLKIPLLDGYELWTRKDQIENKVLLAIKNGIVREYKPSSPNKLYSFNVISDDLGLKGVHNPADGKTYDSKSAYYKAVKNAGCQIVGNEQPSTKKREVQGDFDCRREVSQAIDRTGLMDQLREKRR